MLSDFVFYNCGVLAAQLLRSQTKNSPQDCFLDAPTLSGSSPYRKKEPHFCDSFILAGAEGLEPSARGFGDHCSTN